MKIQIVEPTKESNLLKINFMNSLDYEYEKAHEDYEKRKSEITNKLFSIYLCKEIPAIYRKWIKDAAKFINEKEI